MNRLSPNPSKLFQLGTSIKEFAFKTFFPYKCDFCQVELNYLDDIRICKNCTSQLTVLEGSYCPQCTHPLEDLTCPSCSLEPPLFNQHKILFYYRDTGKNLIHKYKFEKKKSLSQTIARLTLEKYTDYLKQFDVIVPVTIAKKDYFERDFCPVLSVCQKIASRTKIAIVIPIIKKPKQKSQHHKSRQERKTQILEQFTVVKKQIKKLNNKNVLIVDDVLTTGATLNAFYQHIKVHCSPKSLKTFSFTRAILDD